MDPLETWYVIERGCKPSEFLVRFDAAGTWSKDRTVALCWKSVADASTALNAWREKLGFRGAFVGTLNPMFAKTCPIAPQPAPPHSDERKPPTARHKASRMKATRPTRKKTKKHARKRK